MERREALQKISLIIGGTVSIPIATGFMPGCTTDSIPLKAELSTLSTDQNKLVETIAELIIPQTNTPGAKMAGVNKFIDKMVFEWFTENEKTDFFAGLQDTLTHSKKIHNKEFLQCSEQQQVTLLTELEREYLIEKDSSSKKAQFFNNMKRLTIIGFYTSEIGATQELRMPVMGEYLGDIPFGKNDAAWAW